MKTYSQNLGALITSYKFNGPRVENLQLQILKGKVRDILTQNGPVSHPSESSALRQPSYIERNGCSVARLPEVHHFSNEGRDDSGFTATRMNLNERKATAAITMYFRA